MRNGFFAGSAETLPALLFFSFSLLGCFGHIKGGNGIKKVFSGLVLLSFIFFSCAKMFNEMAQNTRSKANFVFMIKV